MSTLPDLSTWHRVPVGATIPKGTPYAYAYKNGINVRPNGTSGDFTVHDNSYYTHYTEHPVTPPLPNEEGATILVSGNVLPPHTLLTRKNGHWVSRSGAPGSVDQVASWAPVTSGETVVMR